MTKKQKEKTFFPKPLPEESKEDYTYQIAKAIWLKRHPEETSEQYDIKFQEEAKKDEESEKAQKE